MHLLNLIALLSSAAGEQTSQELLPYYNRFGFDYRLHPGFHWTGSSGSFGKAHAIGGGTPTTTCFKHRGDDFCISEGTRYLFLAESKPRVVKKCGWLLCDYTLEPAPVNGTAVTISQIVSFNISSFLETTRYAAANRACWDAKMTVSNLRDSDVVGLVGRLFFVVSFSLDFYPKGHLVSTKSKFYDLRFPISLEDGRCNSVFGVFSK